MIGTMNRSSSRVLAALLGFGLLALSASASAQGAGGAAPPAGGGAAPAAGGGAAPAAGGGAAPAAGGGAAPAAGGGATVVFPTYPNAVVAPVPEGGVLGGGNVTGSSSKPITGPGDRDGFDLRASGSGGGTVRGRENGSFIFGGMNARRNPNTQIHSVRKGDTLWGICDHYFSNPYQWPRIWSYNPEIQNPHWIYPGEQVRLRPGAELGAPAATASNAIRGPAQVPAGTVFLRNGGYIEDQSSNWGEINGSPEDKMLLTEGDEVYIRFADNREVKEGQLLTIYRPQGAVRGNGQMIAIQGTVRVDNWRAKDHTARARIVEALDVIERGARIGPIQRRFEVVPPQRNEAETAAQVIASVRNHNFYGQDQVVFIDKGEDAKVKPGNRLLVLRKGDAWHESFIERRAVDRIALESNSPAATESVPRPKDSTKLPEEIVGELRVITVGKHSSMCILLGTRREIELGDKVFLRKGY